VALSQPKPDMWDKILSIYAEVTTSAEETYLAKAKSLSL
jgi:hypothetical protein